ncbi:hypothetical protein AB6F62_09885 [Providencia huaxiensis]|uniref:hypothetical protein n=1 Tax=Providencia huaxiensis TaxID=2027290 RepID=UPI0034DD11BE
MAPFVLDGQTVVLEDYLQVAPERRDCLQKLIKQGRILLALGTQTDFLVVERNLSRETYCWEK